VLSFWLMTASNPLERTQKLYRPTDDTLYLEPLIVADVGFWNAPTGSAPTTVTIPVGFTGDTVMAGFTPGRSVDGKVLAYGRTVRIQSSTTQRSSRTYQPFFLYGPTDLAHHFRGSSLV